MPDSLHALINDTLSYLKDPLHPRQTIFSTAEECSLLQKKPVIRQPISIAKPIAPQTPLPEKVANSPLPEAPKPIIASKEVISPALPTPKAISPEPVPVEAPKPSPTLAREAKPQELSEIDNLSQIKKTLQRIAPAFKLTEEIPDDSEAKKVAGAWREKITDAEVILLACDTDAETLELLKSLAKAIEQHLAKPKIVPADKLEREKRWDLFLQKNSFRLILASDGMQKCPELMRLYRAVPASSQFFLDKTPLLPLSAAPLYKSLEHKALLWKTLCLMLKK